MDLIKNHIRGFHDQNIIKVVYTENKITPKYETEDTLNKMKDDHIIKIDPHHILYAIANKDLSKSNTTISVSDAQQKNNDIIEQENISFCGFFKNLFSSWCRCFYTQIKVTLTTTNQYKVELFIYSNQTVKELIKLYFYVIKRPELFMDKNIRFLCNSNLLLHDSKDLIRKYITKYTDSDSINILIDDLEDKIKLN